MAQGQWRHNARSRGTAVGRHDRLRDPPSRDAIRFLPKNLPPAARICRKFNFQNAPAKCVHRIAVSAYFTRQSVCWIRFCVVCVCAWRMQRSHCTACTALPLADGKAGQLAIDHPLLHAFKAVLLAFHSPSSLVDWLPYGSGHTVTACGRWLE